MNKKYQIISMILKESEFDPLPKDPKERKKELDKRKSLRRKMGVLGGVVGGTFSGIEQFWSKENRKKMAELARKKKFGKIAKRLALPVAAGIAVDATIDPMLTRVSHKWEDIRQKKLKEKERLQQLKKK